jgi:hypothetical protein
MVMATRSNPVVLPSRLPMDIAIHIKDLCSHITRQWSTVEIRCPELIIPDVKARARSYWYYYFDILSENLSPRKHRLVDERGQEIHDDAAFVKAHRNLIAVHARVPK